MDFLFITKCPMIGRTLVWVFDKPELKSWSFLCHLTFLSFVKGLILSKCNIFVHVK